MGYLKGLRPQDGEWKKKRAAVQALVDAGEPVPPSLLKYFGDMDDPKYILEDETRGLQVEIPSKEGSDGENEWIEVLIKDLPPGIERIRFYNTY